MPSFDDIKPFTRDGRYHIDIQLNHFRRTIEKYIDEYNLQLNPDFQRGHVWTRKQQVDFIEYLLRDGISPCIRFNHPNWMGSWEGDMVCVDGLQRCTAILQFLDDKFKVFGGFYSEFDGFSSVSISIRINDLKTRADVLKWYIDLNSGGTVHTDEDIQKVKKLLDKEVKGWI